MVDAVVSFSVEKLGDALIQEAFFLLGVPKQVEELRDELRRMQCFLKDADAKQQQGDESVRNWIADIRNVAYDVEDVVDTFMLKIGATPKSGGVLSLIKKKLFMVKNSGHLNWVGKEIQAIQAKLKTISASTVTYGIKDLRENGASSSIAPLRNYYPHVQDGDITGLEEYTKKLLTELQKDVKRLCVVSIVGVGGLGKTTLAKKIFKDDIVIRHFDCRAWCSVSQQLNMRDVLFEIIKMLMNPNETELSTSSDRNLVEKLYDYLKDKKYFIVMDDLWSIKDWSTLIPAFPNGKQGSKILLTTRNKNVALQADSLSLQLEPEPLNEEKSWELLRKKAFPNTNCYPADLEKLGREMVRKCGGLPLAICVLGGVLATKREDIKKWKYVHKDISSNINEGENGDVMGILALSYNDLPVHLKPCFLYLGLFPEDYAIPRKKLIRLWIAEGFIQHTKENALVTLEEVGKHQYYAELIQRCMIQADKDPVPGQEKTCRMHDLMRDLCLSKGKELNFLDIYDHRIDSTALNSSGNDTGRRSRRYAINLNDHVDFDFKNSASALRTLLVQTKFINPIMPLMKYQHIKLLRVLDIGYIDRDKNEMKVVFELIHLRYLEMRSRFQVKIPSSIGNLRNLQTLKLDGGMSLERMALPETIANLVQLRHLEARTFAFEVGFEISRNLDIGNLRNLQTLVGVRAGKWIKKGCFGKLSKLQNLSVIGTSRSETDVLIHEISYSSSDNHYQNPIKFLEIRSRDNFDNKIFDSLSCCHNLHQLVLFGRLDVLNLQKYPLNLSKLILSWSRLEQDPMETLQDLPNLKLLELLDRAFEGEEMVCSTKGFPQLQVLSIQNMERLKKWTIHQGGMPCLKELTLGWLDELSMLPEGLRFITTLKKLTIDSQMKTIKERIVREVGEDWYKVQHIPSLIVRRY
ncbi:hypothetical protein MKX03_012802 [Papaver bracteatum]|nr:hypothetical protein MKX03_012802 [Papaver bracteatum]